MDTEEIFLHTKPSRILVHLNNPQTDNYASQIAREIDCTYSHVIRIIQKLEEHSLINTKKDGRKKLL